MYCQLILQKQHSIVGITRNARRLDQLAKELTGYRLDWVNCFDCQPTSARRGAAPSCDQRGKKRDRRKLVTI